MNVGSILNDDTPGKNKDDERMSESPISRPKLPSVHERHSITNMLNDAPSEPTLKQPEPTSASDFRKPSITYKPPPPLHSTGSSGHSSARSSPAVQKRNSIANILDTDDDAANRSSSKIESSKSATEDSEGPKIETAEPITIDDDLEKIKKLKVSEKPRRYETPPIWAQRWTPVGDERSNNGSSTTTATSTGGATFTRLSDKPVFDYTSTTSVDLECSITGVIPPSSITRTIAEWIYANFSNVEEKSKRFVELELKFGKIIDKRTGNRIDLSVVTECIYTDQSNCRFEMEVEEIAWKEIKKYFEELEKLHKEDKREKQSARKFNVLDSDNTDTFYQIGNKNEHLRKVRITKDNSLSPPRFTAIQKDRVADLYIHNPQSMYDLRLSLSLEIPVPEGNIETIMAKNQPLSIREKKRTTFTHPPTITQFDLTRVLIPRESKSKSGKKVVQHDTKYEVELEADTLEIFNAIEKITTGVDNFRLEELVEVYLNNARVLNNRVNKIALA
ncbi:CET1 mRNA-capping enzyme subunit beta [Candida maltosa Xu316]